MGTVRKQYDNEILYELVSVFATPDSTIGDYIEVCEHLWRDPSDRVWLLAGLLRKTGSVISEPDQACVKFLFNKACEQLDVSEEKLRSAREQAEFIIPSLISLMDEQIWRDPEQLWPNFVKALAYEMKVKVKMLSQPAAEEISEKDQQVAEFLINAIGNFQYGNLQQLLKPWEGSAEYHWLVGVGDSVRLSNLLQAAKQDSLQLSSLDDPEFFEKFNNLRESEKRRVLRIRDLDTEEYYWPDICHPDQLNETIRWKFVVKLAKVLNINFQLWQHPIGQMRIIRDSRGEVVIEEAEGLCYGLLLYSKQAIESKRAAATEKLSPLSSYLKGTISGPEENQIIIELKWERPERG